MDKTESVSDFDSYIQKMYESYKVLGNITDEFKNATIAGIEMKFFSMELQSND